MESSSATVEKVCLLVGKDGSEAMVNYVLINNLVSEGTEVEILTASSGGMKTKVKKAKDTTRNVSEAGGDKPEKPLSDEQSAEEKKSVEVPGLKVEVRETTTREEQPKAEGENETAYPLSQEAESHALKAGLEAEGQLLQDLHSKIAQKVCSITKKASRYINLLFL